MHTVLSLYAGCIGNCIVRTDFSTCSHRFQLPAIEDNHPITEAISPWRRAVLDGGSGDEEPLRVASCFRNDMAVGPSEMNNHGDIHHIGRVFTITECSSGFYLH